MRVLPILVAALALACRETPRPAEPVRPRHVLLVSIDTLRADHVGAARAGVPLTPAIDAIAARGTTFTDAIANCTVTRSSHASMLTGLLPWRHGIPDNSGQLKPEVPTLAELLAKAGVTTGAVTSSFPLRDLGRGFQTFHQAFDRVDPNRANEPMASPEATTGAAIQWLAGRGREERWFLFVHYFPPHGPYTPPHTFRLPPADVAGEAPLAVSARNYEWNTIPAYQKIGDLRAPTRYRERYAAHVRYVDDSVGRLVAELEARGMWDDTAVIVTSDHGESLGERGWYFVHGNLTYAEQSAVPMILKVPGGTGAQRTDAPVQGADVFATVLELLGVPVPAGGDGRSLLQAIAKPDRSRLRYTQSGDAEQLSVVGEGWKLTRVVEKPARIEPGHVRRALYRLKDDPGEARNVADTAPQVASALERELDRTFTGFAPAAPLDPETEERLRALGYIR